MIKSNIDYHNFVYVALFIRKKLDIHFWYQVFTIAKSKNSRPKNKMCH